MKHNGEVVIISGNSNRALVKRICDELGIDESACEVKQFSDGEISIDIMDSVRGRDVFVIQPTSGPVNDHLMELLILIDALKRASAGRINAVVPYYGYARQDRKVRAREPITAKLVANLITVSGADRVICMDLHAGQIQGYFDIPVDHLTAVPYLAKYFKSHIDTAGTVCKAAEALRNHGAKRIYGCATHGVLSGPAIERIDNSIMERFVITDTIELPEEKHIDKIDVVSVAPILASAIRRVNTDRSISKIFEEV